MKRLIGFACLFLHLTASASGLRLYFSANRHGEVEPCGCAVNQLGGLGRLQNFLATEEKGLVGSDRPALFVDSGDTFFAAESVSPSRKEQELLRARLIATAYRKFGVAAMTPGERDFAAGVAVLEELAKASGVAMVSANLTRADGTALFEAHRIVKIGGIAVGLTGATDEAAMARVEGVKATPALPALQAAVKALRSQGAQLVVVLSHLGLPVDREIAKSIEGIDYVLGAHSLDALNEPVVVGKTQIFQPQIQGQQIGLVDINGSGVAAKYRVVDLTKELDAANSLTALVDEYKKKVREIALSDSPTASVATSDKPFVAHPQLCRNCHAKQHDFWQTTKHASAYLVLYAKNQHFDPECISCHSLGFEEPGGFSKIASPIALSEPRKKKGEPFVEGLMKKVFAAEPKGAKPLDSRQEPERYARLKQRYHDEIAKLEDQGKIQRIHVGVQCEHCHGNRHGHPGANVKTVKQVSEESCKKCHHPPHDNAFNFAERVKKVACPLSGKG